MGFPIKIEAKLLLMLIGLKKTFDGDVMKNYIILKFLQYTFNGYSPEIAFEILNQDLINEELLSMNNYPHFHLRNEIITFYKNNILFLKRLFINHIAENRYSDCQMNDDEQILFMGRNYLNNNCTYSERTIDNIIEIILKSISISP